MSDFYTNLDAEAESYTDLDFEADAQAGGGLEEFGKGVVSSTIGVAKEVVIQGLTDIIKAPGEYLSFVLPEYEKAAPKEQREKLIAPLKTAKRRMEIAQAAFKKTHKGTAAWAGRALGEAVPYMATAMAGGIIVGPIGAATVGFSVEGGEAYESAKRTGATEEQAQLERGIVGSINAAIEAVQIGRLMRFQTAGRHSIKGLVALAKKKAYGKMTKEGVKFSGRILRHSLEEGAEEFLQQGVSFAVPANLRDEMPRKPDGSPDLLAIGSQLGAAYAGGMFAGGILGGAGAVSINTDIRQKVADLTKELTPGQRNEILGGIMDQAVEDDPTMTPEEKYSAKFVLGNIRTNIEEELVSRLNTNDVEIVDNRSLAEVGNDIAKASGITKKIHWKFPARKTKARMGTHTTDVDGIDLIKINGGHWAFFGADRQMELRHTIMHELGHMAAPPTTKQVMTEFPKSAKVLTTSDPGRYEIRYRGKLTNIYAANERFAKERFVEFQGERRSIHHAEFKKWYNDNVGILIPEIKKTLGPVMEAHLQQEAEQLGELGLKAGEPTPAAEGGVKKYVAKVAKSGQLPDTQKPLMAFKIGDDIIYSDAPTHPQVPLTKAQHYQVVTLPKDPAGFVFEGKFYNRDEWVAHQQAQPPAKPVTEAQAIPKKRSRKKLLALGHKIPKQAGLSDDERRDLMEEITGKRSLKQLTSDELEAYIETLEGQFGTAVLGPEDYQKPIQVGDQITTMANVMNSAAADVEALPQKKKIPKVITKKFARGREKTRWKRLGDILWGEENTVLYALAEKLGPTFSDVIDINLQRSYSIRAGHSRSTFEFFINFMKKAGVTDADLAHMSKSQNPRFRFVQAIQEMQGTGTEIQKIEINGTEFEMTVADLMDIYLILGQDDGIRHVREGGLVINTVETGAIDEDTMQKLTDAVESNPKAKVIVDTILEIGKDIWKPSINNVSQRMEGKDIAVIENWWGLEVYAPKRLGGKQERFNMNLIENRSIFKDRTKSSRPLVVRDMFSRFAVFENGIAEYVGYAESTRIARGLMNNPDIATALDQKGYGDTRKRIITILERAQSIPRGPGAFGKFMSEQLPWLYRAYLHFNPRVVVSQATSSGNYGAFVTGKYLIHIKDGFSREAIEETLRLSDIAYDRFYMGHSSLALGEAAKSDAVLRMFTHKSADINKLGITLRMADMVALAGGMRIAQAEYKDAQAGTIGGESAIYWADKNMTFEEGTTDAEREITRRAEWLWQRSQPSWDKWNRSMATSGLFRQIFFPFRTFHEKSLTIIQQANEEYRRSNKSIDDKLRKAKKWGAVLSSYSVNMIIRAMLMAIAARKLKEPWQYVSDLIEAPMGMFPVLGPLLKNSIGNFINVLIDEKVEFHGKLIEAFPATMINLAGEAGADFSIAAGHYLDGDTEKAKTAFQRALKKIYKAVGTSEGIPVSEMNRVYKGWVEGEEEPTQRGRRRARRVRPRKVRARR